MGVASDVVRVPGDRRHGPSRPAGRDDPRRARRRGRSSPSRPAAARTGAVATASSSGPTTAASTASCAPTDDDVLELVRDADVLLDSGGRFDPDVVAAVNPAVVHVTVSGVRARRPEGRLGGVGPDDPRRRVLAGAQRRQRPGARAHVGAPGVAARRRRGGRRRAARPHRAGHERARPARRRVGPAGRAAGGDPRRPAGPERQPGGPAHVGRDPRRARSTCSSCTRPPTATSRSRCCSAR